jgi:hypothetical protein
VTARCFLACMIWLLLAARPHAAGLYDTVPGHHGLTYFDLMKHVVPDLTKAGDSATGKTIVPFTHIDGRDLKAEPDAISLKEVDVIPIPGGATRTVLSVDLGSAEGSLAGAKFLALFSLAPAVKLLDIVEIGGDRFVDVTLARPPDLGRDTPLILVNSWHDNSNQSYGLVDMIFIRNGRFRQIDNVFTLGDAYCGYRRTQSIDIKTVADGAIYRAVEVTVRQEVTLADEDCGDEKLPVAAVTTYRATYRWNLRRQDFTTNSHDLDRLAAFNRKRM